MVINKMIDATWLQRLWWFPNLMWSLIMLRYKWCSQSNLETIFMYLIAVDHRIAPTTSPDLLKAMHMSIDAMFEALFEHDGDTYMIPNNNGNQECTPRKMSKAEVAQLEAFIWSVLQLRKTT